MTTLFRGGPIRTLAGVSDPSWVLIEGARIVGAGGAADEPHAESVVDLGGACLLPAFCDAHVHLGASGMRAGAVDLSGLEHHDDVLAAIATGPSTGSILALDLEEGPAGFPPRAGLDRAVAGRPALVSRADLHSCLVSSALLDDLDLRETSVVERDEEGHPTGVLREDAAGVAWRAFESQLGRAEIAAGMTKAADAALGRGVAGIHEMFVVGWKDWSALDDLVEWSKGHPLEVEIYVGTDDVAAVVERGLDRVGGDWFLDGTLGSHTAWLEAPYTDRAGSGLAYRARDELVEWCRTAARAGLQTAVHAIGDAAINQIVSVWEEVASEVGLPAVRAGLHRIEHFEMATDDLIGRAAALGLAACVQPGFDRRWGGTGGMYARRLGLDRARGMNRFATMERTGVCLGLGSDAPITPLDPWEQCADWLEHSVPGERVGAAAALKVHTSGSWSLGGSDAGTIAAGRPAHLLICDRDPVDADPDGLRGVEVLSTWIGGRRVWP